MVAARSPRKRSILGVCEHFEGKADAEGVLLRGFPTIEQTTPSLYGRNSISGTNLVAARSPRKRSILGVCEHFEGKADAEGVPLRGFPQLNRVRKYKACENATSGAYLTYVSIVALSVTQ
ncbi:MAG: hypothetical protein Q4F45_05225 [Alistipes sp.]|nr:hypothetical protein [Alistipes sp.]